MRSGRYTATVPVRVVHYLPEERERWRKLRKIWEASRRTDWSAWKEFKGIARSHRFVFAHRQNAGPFHFFGEALIARDLERQGFTTWATGRLLPQRNLKGVYAQQREILEAMLREQGLPSPSRYVERLNFRPRNPDLTAFHPKLGWRFIEVKVNRDRMKEEQLQTLAFLGRLLRCQVEVVRVVGEGTRVRSDELFCSFTLRGNTSGPRS